jgi:WD40 repeat protein
MGRRIAPFIPVVGVLLVLLFWAPPERSRADPQFINEGSPVFRTDFSPGGNHFIGLNPSFDIEIWDASSGKRSHKFDAPRDWGSALALSPSGALVALAREDNTILLRVAASGKPTLTLPGHSSPAFSPGGGILASKAGDNTIKLWDTASGRLLRTLSGHTDSVLSVAFFSPNGRSVAAAGSDNSVAIWDVASGQLVHALRGHSGAVLSLAFTRDGKFLASASLDYTIKVWELASELPVRTLELREAAVAVAFSPDGERLASAGENSLNIWDVTSWDSLRGWSPHAGAIGPLMFSPDGKSLLCAHRDGSVVRWNACGAGRDFALAQEVTETLNRQGVKGVPQWQETRATGADPCTSPFALSSDFRVRQLGVLGKSKEQGEEYLRRLWREPESYGWFVISGQWKWTSTREAAWRALMDLRFDRISPRLLFFLTSMLPFWLVLLTLALGLKALELPLHQRPDRWGALLVVDVIATVWASRALSDFAPQFALDGAGSWLAGGFWHPGVWISVLACLLITILAVRVYSYFEVVQARNTAIASSLLMPVLLIGSLRGWPAPMIVFWTVLAVLSWLAQIEISVLRRVMAPEPRTR